MSRLFFTERGRSLVAHNEEITRWRWAKKLLELPPSAASSEADIWLFLQMYRDNHVPLEVRLGGKRLAVIEPDPALAALPAWQKLAVPAGRLFARSVIVTENFNTPAGHFVAEIWDARLEQWVLHDPNFDLHYEDDRPLSALDIADRNHRGESLRGCEVMGEDNPAVPPHLVDWFDRVLLSGRCFRCTGIWAINQYVSNPAVAPPSHGAVSYCETDIVWYNPVGVDLAPMFPYRTAKRGYFDRKP
jgi:hypothetical protein